jgi:PAT family beta-lactamase induction signal transducer AmpG
MLLRLAMDNSTKKAAPAVWWVPSSYLAMGFVLCALTLSTTFVFKNLGVEKSTITMLAAILMLPYTFKFLWAPLLELYKTKKFFVVLMQLCAAVLMALAGLALKLPVWLAITFGAMMVCAFVGATIDIGTDGVYVTTLDDKQKARWAGIQSMAWTGGQFIASGRSGLGRRQATRHYGYTWQIAWMYVFLAAAVILVGLGRVARRLHAPRRQGQGRAQEHGRSDGRIRPRVQDLLPEEAHLAHAGLGLLLSLQLVPHREGQQPLPHHRSHRGWPRHEQPAAGQISGWGSFSFLAASVVGGLVLAKVGLSRKTLMLFVGTLVIPNLAFMYLGQLASPMPATSSHHRRLVPSHVRLRLRRRRAHVLHDEADLPG